MNKSTGITISLIFVILFSVYVGYRSIWPLDKPKVRIINESQHLFDSVLISNSGSNSVNLGQLKPNQSLMGTFEINTEGDGNYQVLAYQDSMEIKKSGFGYFTNGGSLDRQFTFLIKPDLTTEISDGEYSY